MTSAPEATERKARSFDDDVQTLLVMVTSIRATQLRHDNRLDQIDRSIADRESDLRELRNGLAELGTRIDRILTLLER